MPGKGNLCSTRASSAAFEPLEREGAPVSYTHLDVYKRQEEIRSAGDVILFIDEMHTIIGAGAAEGAIDAANILKPALARGELQAIGATTLDEYQKLSLIHI